MVAEKMLLGHCGLFVARSRTRVEMILEGPAETSPVATAAAAAQAWWHCLRMNSHHQRRFVEESTFLEVPWQRMQPRNRKR
jgi:hypothetical protein